MYPRYIRQNLIESLGDSPVVMVVGARQTGKTTLVRQVAAAERPARYISLDDPTFMSAAASDPVGFLAGLSGPVVIDEVQHAPGLFPAIKSTVDYDRAPGRFLLTGSANVLLLPKVSESLAGRIQVLTLWPLAQAEIEGGSAGIVDLLFARNNHLPVADSISRSDLARRIVAGGYPEPLTRSSPARRTAWFNSHVTTILQRDVRDIANIEGLTDLPRLLQLLASRTTGLLNNADISRGVGIPYSTLNRYMSLLQTTFLIRLLPAWSANLGLRLVKSPKLLFVDTGLAASQIGLDTERLISSGALYGQLLETFVTMEMIKAAEVSRVLPTPYHFRTVAGHEVDLVLESPSGEIVGLEIKAASSVSAEDFRGLRALEQATADRFVRGVVLYNGSDIVPFGERLHAAPLSAIWSSEPTVGRST
jgi:hypothetical protein